MTPKIGSAWPLACSQPLLRKFHISENSRIQYKSWSCRRIAGKGCYRRKGTAGEKVLHERGNQLQESRLSLRRFAANTSRNWAPLPLPCSRFLWLMLFGWYLVCTLYREAKHWGTQSSGWVSWSPWKSTRFYDTLHWYIGETQGWWERVKRSALRKAAAVGYWAARWSVVGHHLSS